MKVLGWLIQDEWIQVEDNEGTYRPMLVETLKEKGINVPSNLELLTPKGFMSYFKKGKRK